MYEQETGNVNVPKEESHSLLL